MGCISFSRDLLSPGIDLARDGVSREVPCSALKGETVPDIEMWLHSLGWEDLLEEDMASYSSILAWRIPMNRRAWQATVHVVTKSRT